VPYRYRFQDLALLRLALTHCSASEQNGDALAWLGDSMLMSVVTELLMASFSSASLGELTELRVVLVSRQTCSRRGVELGIGDIVTHGVGLEVLVRLGGNLVGLEVIVGPEAGARRGGGWRVLHVHIIGTSTKMTAF
jgi:dsRNA-specific ribonuclease